MKSDVNVCIIDDNEEYLRALSRPLATKYHVHLFENAGHFLREFENGAPADIVCVDYKIPDMNGIELCRAIRRMDHLLPVVMVSGWIDKTVALEAVAVGITEILEKPCGLDVFMEAIGRAAEIRSLSRTHNELFEGCRKLISLYQELVAKCEARYTLAENKALSLNPFAFSDRPDAREYLQYISSTSALHREIDELYAQLCRVEWPMRLGPTRPRTALVQEKPVSGKEERLSRR